MLPNRTALVLLATSLMLIHSPLHAQEWNLDAQAGRIRSALDPGAPEAETVALGLRYDDALTAFRISGGIPTAASDPLWASAAGARRMQLRRSGFVIGLDIAGNALLLHDRTKRTQEVPGGVFEPPAIQPLPSRSGTAFAVQALPLIGFEAANVQAYARGGVSSYTSRLGDLHTQRTVRIADAQVTYAPATSFVIGPVFRFFDADEGRYSYAGVTAAVGKGVATAWGTLGTWLSDHGQPLPWAAGATIRIHERAAINASLRHDGIDPLYQTPPQTSWSAGVSFLIGARPQQAAPIPARYESGRATIRLKANDERTQLKIAGDFNGWKPAPMQRTAEAWTYTVAVRPGVYNYAFVNDRGEWFVPEKYPGRKEDGMGGYVAVLVVQ